MNFLNPCFSRRAMSKRRQKYDMYLRFLMYVRVYLDICKMYTNFCSITLTQPHHHILPQSLQIRIEYRSRSSNKHRNSNSAAKRPYLLVVPTLSPPKRLSSSNSRSRISRDQTSKRRGIKSKSMEELRSYANKCQCETRRNGTQELTNK